MIKKKYQHYKLVRPTESIESEINKNPHYKKVHWKNQITNNRTKNNSKQQHIPIELNNNNDNKKTEINHETHYKITAIS